MRDADGAELAIGSRVLILRLNPAIFDPLEDDERAIILEMLKEPFEVCEFSDSYVYVEAGKEFPQGWEFHKFAVSPEHLRKVA